MSDPTYANVSVNFNFDSFASHVTKTNQLITSMLTTVVTVDPLAPVINATTYGLSTGNGFVVGQFGANTLVAANGIQGGTIGTPGVINLLTNVISLGTFLANAAVTLSNTISVTGNATFSSAVSVGGYKFSSVNSTTNSSTIGLASNTELATTLAVFNYVTNAISTAGSGSVTSVQASGGPTGLVFSGGPITSTGTLTLANSSVLGISYGGTGANNQQAALDNISGAVTTGSFLRGDGTHVSMSAIQAADVPTLNQNTTGTANNVTGIVAIVNGGTGANNKTSGFNALSPITSVGDIIIGNGVNSSIRLAIGAANTVLVSNGTTAAWTAYSPGYGAATLRNVTGGYTSGGQVFISSTAPTANNAGDIWIQF